jgi:hypothetical protein
VQGRVVRNPITAGLLTLFLSAGSDAAAVAADCHSIRWEIERSLRSYEAFSFTFERQRTKLSDGSAGTAPNDAKSSELVGDIMSLAGNMLKTAIENLSAYDAARQAGCLSSSDNSSYEQSKARLTEAKKAVELAEAYQPKLTQGTNPAKGDWKDRPYILSSELSSLCVGSDVNAPVPHFQTKEGRKRFCEGYMAAVADAYNGLLAKGDFRFCIARPQSPAQLNAAYDTLVKSNAKQRNYSAVTTISHALMIRKRIRLSLPSLLPTNC